MKIMNQHPENKVSKNTQNSSVQNLGSSSFAGRAHHDVAYHELAEIPVQQIDPLEQLQQNVDRLSSMTSKMQFMMREVRYLLKV